MRATALLFVLPALASATYTSLTARQDALAGLPDCALGCLGQLGSTCTLGDVSCYCQDPSVITNVQACLPGVCQGDDLQAATDAANGLCASSGVSTTFDLSATDSARASTDASGTDSAALTESSIGIETDTLAPATSLTGTTTAPISAVPSGTSLVGSGIPTSRSAVSTVPISASSLPTESATGGATSFARAGMMGICLGLAIGGAVMGL